MKSVLSLALLVASASAFTTRQPLLVGTTKSIHGLDRQGNHDYHHPSIVCLNAGKNKEKIASRTKWAEGRGYGDSSSSSDSDDDDGDRKRAPKLIIAGAPASGKGTQ